VILGITSRHINVICTVICFGAVALYNRIFLVFEYREHFHFHLFIYSFGVFIYLILTICIRVSLWVRFSVGNH